MTTISSSPPIQLPTVPPSNSSPIEELQELKKPLFPEENEGEQHLMENLPANEQAPYEPEGTELISTSSSSEEGVQEGSKEVGEGTSLDEIFLRVLREQIERDRTEGSSPLTENKLPPFIVPRGREELFNAPLNISLLKRDYAIWKRILGISQFIFTTNALQYQGISQGSMLLGTAGSVLLTRYFPVFSVVAASAYSGFCALKNLGATFLGTDSLKDREEIWSSASNQTSFFAALSRRVTALTGTDSLFSRCKSAAWGLAQAYLTTIGRDFLFQRQDNPWTSVVVDLFKGAQQWILPIPAAIAAGGIGYFGLMVAMSMNYSSSQKLQDQFEGLSEDISFSSEYQRLLYLSDEEYETELLRSLGVNHRSELEEKRKEYAGKVRARMHLKDYLGADQVQIDAQASLKKLNPTHPHRSLKPVLAQYQVLVERKKAVLEQYRKMLEEHAYAAAHSLLNQVLKPLILKVEFLNQTLLDPTRPPLGLIMNEGGAYYSYISVLSGTEIKENITLTDPEELEVFFANLLINETAIHKYLCFERGIMEVNPSYLVRQAELMKQQSPSS